MDDYVERILDREAVTYLEKTVELDDEEFVATRERARSIDGGVAVVIHNAEGEILLLENDWSDGYIPPGGGVEPDEDPEAAAVREAHEETGVQVELERPIRVERRQYVREDDETDGGKDDVKSFRGGYDVTFLAHPIGDESLADHPGLDDETIESVGWFEAAPERTPVPDLLETVFDRVADTDTDS